MDFKLQRFDKPMSVTSLANLHYFEFTKEFHSHENSHDFCELLYVDSGKIEVLSDSFEGVLCENELIIHRPGEKHSLCGNGKISPNVIIIGFECKSKELKPFSSKAVSLSGENRRLLSRIMQEGMSIFEPPYDIPNTVYMKKREVYPFGADQMIKTHLETFLITLVREYRELNKGNSVNSFVMTGGIEGIYRYITEHYTEKISLGTLCFIFGTNKTSLCCEFKKHYGMTVLEYIRALRVNAAKELLCGQSKSVTEISYLLGFESVHYFSRIFKQCTGISPSDYAEAENRKDL